MSTQIAPISLESDIKHISAVDQLSASSIRKSTKTLATRDNTLNDKLNEVITAVNNQEQLVPLSIASTVVPALTSLELTNIRIPYGFEARILNAVISSTPSSTVKLNIYYNIETFGGSTGTEIVSTLTEFTDGTLFKNSGEFIVQAENTSQLSSEAIISILLSIRPAINMVGNVISPGAVGKRGYKGAKGDAGIKGDPGINAAGVVYGTTAPSDTNSIWTKIYDDGQFDGIYVYIPTSAGWYTRMPDMLGTVKFVNTTGLLGLGWEDLTAAAGYVPIATGTAINNASIATDNTYNQPIAVGQILELASGPKVYGLREIVFTGINCLIRGIYAYKSSSQDW